MEIWIIITAIALIIGIILFIFYFFFNRKNNESSLFGGEFISLSKNKSKKATPPLITNKNDALKTFETLEKNKENLNLNPNISGKMESEKKNKIEQKNETLTPEKNSGIENDNKQNEKEKLLDKNSQEILSSSNTQVIAPISETSKAKSSESIADNSEIGYIKFENIDNLLIKINDSNIREILNFIKDKNYDFIDKRLLHKTFSLKDNILDFLKVELVSFLKDAYENLKSRISESRRKGLEVENASMRLMSVPLKIKLFESEFSKKNFLNILLIMEDVENELKNITVK